MVYTSINSTYKCSMLLGVLCSDCGGILRRTCQGHCLAHPTVDVRQKIPPTLCAHEDCSLTWNGLWLTTESIHIWVCTPSSAWCLGKELTHLWGPGPALVLPYWSVQYVFPTAPEASALMIHCCTCLLITYFNLSFTGGLVILESPHVAAVWETISTDPRFSQGSHSVVRTAS